MMDWQGMTPSGRSTTASVGCPPALGRRPTPRLLAGLALLLVGLAPAPRAQEVVTTDFDLEGWLEAGVVSLGSNHFDSGSLRRLLDNSVTTGVRADVDGLVSLSLAFQPPQFVREIALRPGDDTTYAMGITLSTADGERSELAEQVVSGGNPAVFRPIDQRLASFELTVESLELERVIDLVGLRVVGELAVRGLVLENVPGNLPEGGSFEVRVRGIDSFGGRPDVTAFADILVSPTRALEGISKGRYKTRVGGPIALAPRLRSVEGNVSSVMVRPRDPPLPEPGVVAGYHVVQLELEGTPPFRVLRRNSGEKSARSVGITWSNHFYDEGVEAGAAYQYSVVRVDRFGNSLSEPSEEARVRTRTRPSLGMVDIGRCPVLVALYVDSFDQDGVQGEAERIVQSIEAARTFLFRHSGGRLMLDVSYLAVPGPSPSTAGPSMGGVERDLRDLGIGNDDFAVVFAVSNAFTSAHGNFLLLGRTGGAFGRGPGVPTPPGALGPDPAVAWVFVHEVRHVLAGRIAPSVGENDQPSGDFEQDFRFGPLGAFRGRPLDIGEAWDGQAALAHDLGWWSRVQPPYRRPFEVIDSDGDGLPDDDPRAPFDEARFGSSPNLADTDGDGLHDADEAWAGLYGGTDPTRADSDGDGLADGIDPWPLSDFGGTIAYGTEPQPLARGPLVDQPTATLAACWNEDALVLRVTTPFAADVYVDLDGSGRLGRWESDVYVEAPTGRTADVWCGPARIALRAHQQPTGVFIAGQRVPGATVAATTLEGGVIALTASLPATLGAGAEDATSSPYADPIPGLRLVAGSVFGLAVTVRPSRTNDPAPWLPFTPDAPWVSLLETNRLYDSVLAPPEG